LNDTLKSNACVKHLHTITVVEDPSILSLPFYSDSKKTWA